MLIYDLGMVFVGPDGIRIEQVVLHKHLQRPPRVLLRVKHGRYLVADCATVAEVAKHVDLATLSELIPSPRTSS